MKRPPARALLSATAGDQTAWRDPASVAGALRERVYASLTGVATLMLLLIYVEEETVASSVISLVVAMTTLWLASLVSEFIAHTATHEDTAADRSGTIAQIFYTAGQSLELMVVPVGVILLSLTGLWELRTALILAVAALMVTLAVASIYAVRRSSFGWLHRLFIVAVELGLGALVIVAKIVAH
ncbi:MAG: hypothetical protein AVDCRST_MAG33-2442 [uncultured Thermomicrobiales bacterium]|uniref:Uncharacterized protein n=1 Tax=uncultured Thermomicrobiales bacterium TaxID=1645740 RepID=A0A6J4V6M6_9BACT|nr:MAG: hypothetical protein AVDCRST_MAG33-2442 [uncultured Thermomicrobiales bacterium]